VPEAAPLGTDEDIDREFNAVCQIIWGFTLDDFDDDRLVKADHDWLDELTARRAYRFAAENGYELGDYANGEMVSERRRIRIIKHNQWFAGVVQ
jgi:hypothetical protein